MHLQHVYLVELKKLLLGLVSSRVVCKAVVAKGIGPLEHAAAVHHLGPSIGYKFQLAGGCGCDLTQILQLLANDFVQRLQCLQDGQRSVVHILVTVQLLNQLSALLTLHQSVVAVQYDALTFGHGSAHSCTEVGQRTG